MTAVLAVAGASNTEPAGTWILPVIKVATPLGGVNVVPEGTMILWPEAMIADDAGASVMVDVLLTTRERLCVLVVAGVDESVTVTENVKVPAVVGVPERTPVLLSVRPAGSVLPLATVQV
ncbi:MAG TPA: hypothetical protein VJ604_01075 [Geomonas sp.]|nr:hypothetical protein [Geomonas sp.]